jgi:hypothetical protein
LVLLWVGSTPGLGVSTALTVGFEVSPVVVAGSSSPRLRVGVISRLVLLASDGRSASVAPSAVSCFAAFGYLDHFVTAFT